MTLVEFLRARLDDDQEAASRVHQPYRLYACDDGCLEEPMRADDLYGPRDGEYETWADGEDLLPNHHNSWALVYDPARVLADVAAKRAILDEHAPRELMAMGDDLYSYPGMYCGCCSPRDPQQRQRHPCRTLRLLATAYADHPDFDPAWQPAEVTT
jgi:hypothetical protein